MDERLRRLHRAWQASNSLADFQAFYLEQLRTGAQLVSTDEALHQYAQELDQDFAVNFNVGLGGIQHDAAGCGLPNAPELHWLQLSNRHNPFTPIFLVNIYLDFHALQYCLVPGYDVELMTYEVLPNIDSYSNQAIAAREIIKDGEAGEVKIHSVLKSLGWTSIPVLVQLAGQELFNDLRRHAADIAYLRYDFLEHNLIVEDAIGWVDDSSNMWRVVFIRDFIGDNELLDEEDQDTTAVTFTVQFFPNSLNIRRVSIGPSPL